MVEARAVTRYVRMSPQKARLVLDLIRGRQADQAIQTLRLTRKRAAKDIEKCLRSAIANAEQKSEKVDVDNLVVSKCWVNEGPRWKRVRPAPFGRAYRYLRRTAHITIFVTGEEEQPRPGGVAPRAEKGKGEKAAPAAPKAAPSAKPASGKAKADKEKP
uniref:Large ribosomal subunit protein uL22 n=1 Tax=uncultured Acidobacteria bacterium Rifle_16ft_4_minimus_37967 TaxID=1665087 RepID=A0A0H4T9F4_9BACT|nr:50S ribosomal protein L22, large subunit ribosomal protein L22 [uncultured Acidobacteria bacterium Rifle_16ft_4_minimus_37967]